MIFGDCPYCGAQGAFNVPEDEQLPVMVKVDCHSCGKWFWEYLSRVHPAGYRQEDVIVDEERKTVQVIERNDANDAT